MPSYRFGHLQFDSDISLADFLPLYDAIDLDSQFDNCKISIQRCLPDVVSLDINDGVLEHFAPKDQRIRFHNIADFSIRNGNYIGISYHQGATHHDIVICLLGPVLACLCYQRECWLLHASAVKIDGKAVLIAGRSGAGKSTVAAAFADEGFDVLGDELLHLNQVDSKSILEAGLRASLLQRSETASLDSNSVEGLIDKSIVSYTDQETHFPIPISHIYILQTSDVASPDLQIEELNPLEKLKSMIEEATYRYHWIAEMGLERPHAQFIAPLVECVEIKKIKRCNQFSTGNAAVTAILDNVLHSHTG